MAIEITDEAVFEFDVEDTDVEDDKKVVFKDTEGAIKFVIGVVDKDHVDKYIEKIKAAKKREVESA